MAAMARGVGLGQSSREETGTSIFSSEEWGRQILRWQTTLGAYLLVYVGFTGPYVLGVTIGQNWRRLHRVCDPNCDLTHNPRKTHYIGL
jgi:hypothetical protein